MLASPPPVNDGGGTFDSLSRIATCKGGWVEITARTALGHGGQASRRQAHLWPRDRWVLLSSPHRRLLVQSSRSAPPSLQKLRQQDKATHSPTSRFRARHKYARSIVALPRYKEKQSNTQHAQQLLPFYIHLCTPFVFRRQWWQLPVLSSCFHNATRGRPVASHEKRTRLTSRPTSRRRYGVEE